MISKKGSAITEAAIVLAILMIVFIGFGTILAEGSKARFKGASDTSDTFVPFVPTSAPRDYKY